MSPLVLAVGAAALAALLLAARRWNELFRLRLRGGRLELVRGRLPPALFTELREVLARAGARDAVVRAVVASGAARVLASGLGEDDVQRLRNVVGRFPLAQLRAGRLQRGVRRRP